MEDVTRARVLDELAAEFAGWRFGRGGSGHWWAVRGNEFLRALSVEELRAALRRPPMVEEIRPTDAGSVEIRE